MRKALKHYAAKEPSGLEWLGDIPSHWRVERAKSHLYAIDRRSNSGQEELLTVSSRCGVIPRRSANVTMFKAESYVGYKLCWPDDLVINSLWAWANGLGVSKYHGIISSAYGVYRQRNAGLMLPGFLHYLVRSSPFQWELQVRSRGIWTSRLQLTDERFLDTPLVIPPAEEQAAIVRYLDWACGRLDRAIRAKRKIIALLNEQKQAIIHRAVTRGLDSNVPLKHSGVDWLGDVPSGWSLRRAKYLFREVDERSASGSEELLSVSHITGVTPRSQKNITMFKAESYAGHKLCKPGELVINTMWAWMGALGVSGDFGIVSPAYAVYRQRNEEVLMPQFVDLLLRTRTYVDEFTRRSTGIRSSRMRMYPEEFFKVEILIPPYSAQQNILKFIAARTENLDKSIERVNAELDLLREYRTRLIADVVTGKLDVREAAAKLPEEVVQPIEIESEELEPDEEEMAVAGQIDA